VREIPLRLIRGRSREQSSLEGDLEVREEISFSSIEGRTSIGGKKVDNLRTNARDDVALTKV